MSSLWLAACLTLAAFLAALWRLRRHAARRGRAYVLIDGSNVMHWNKGAPDIAVVRSVAGALAERGYAVGVIFDANVGYKLSDHYMNEAALARLLRLPERQVMVSPRGEPADGFLLRAARDENAPIVTNDRFRDWQDDYPEIAAPGRLIHGGYRDGAPYLRPSKGKPL